jgi:hypothetical protein
MNPQSIVISHTRGSMHVRRAAWRCMSVGIVMRVVRRRIGDRSLLLVILLLFIPQKIQRPECCQDCTYYWRPLTCLGQNLRVCVRWLAAHTD